MATADDDINELHGWVMKFARSQLVKHGEFYPFGATMTSEGQIQPQMASNGVGRSSPTIHNKKESDDVLYDGPYSLTNTERNFFG